MKIVIIDEYKMFFGHHSQRVNVSQCKKEENNNNNYQMMGGTHEQLKIDIVMYGK